MSSIYIKEEPWGGAGVAGKVYLYANDGTPQTLRYFTETGKPSGILGSDFYESGFWTPKLWDTSFSDSDCTYNVQYGWYQRYSVFCYVIFRMELATESFASDLYLGNLPYTCSSTYKGNIQLSYNNLHSTSGDPPVGFNVLFGDTKGYMQQWDVTTGTTQVEYFSITGTVKLHGTGWYVV